MLKAKLILAIAVTFCASLLGSVTSARHEIPNRQSENDISERLNSAAENLKDDQTQPSGYIFEKFTQWYNWSNWNNWQNWGNW